MSEPKAFSKEHLHLANMAQGTTPLDLNYVFSIIKQSPQFDILGLCFEALYANRDRIINQLIDRFDQEKNEDTRYAIVFICSLNPSPASMSICLDAYINHRHFRKLIKENSFSDKTLLATSLILWVEEHPYTKKQKETLYALIDLVPKKTWLLCPGFAQSKLSTLYFTHPKQNQR